MNASGNDSLILSDSLVKALSDDVDIENGSAVDRSVVMETSLVGQDVNGEVVNNNDELADDKEIADVAAESDDAVSAVTFDLESTLNTSETSRVTDLTPESIINPSGESKSQVTITQPLSADDVVNTSDEMLSIPNQVQNADCEVMVNDEPESIKTVINESGCKTTLDGSGKPSEDLEGQVIADGSESLELEAHVTVDGSGKLSDGLECQNAIDGSESSGSTIEEQKGQVTVDGSESIDSLVDNQEHLVLVGDSERVSDLTKEVDASTIVMESDVKSEEHQELLLKTLEVNVEEERNPVCDGIKTEHKSESMSPSYPSYSKQSGESNIGSGIESESYPDTGLVSSEDTDALVDGKVEKLDGILEMGETQVSGIEACESESLLLNADKEKPEGNDIQERFVKPTESEELIADIEGMTEQVNIENDIHESRTVVIDNVQDDLSMDNTAEPANDADVSSETVTNIEPITHKITVSHCESSNCIVKSQDRFHSEESPENVETLGPVKSECEAGELLVKQENGSLSNPDDSTVAEQKTEPGTHFVTDNRAAEGTDFEAGVEIVDVPDDAEKELAGKDSPVEFLPDLVTENSSAECIDSQPGIENSDAPNDEEKETDVKDTHVRDDKTSSYPDTIMNPVSVIEFGSFGRHETIPNIVNGAIKVPDVINEDIKPACVVDSDNIEQDINGSLTDGNNDKRSSVEGSVSDATDVQDEKAEVLKYNFLIRIPRFEDESFREDIRRAQSQVTEKTSLRDAIRVQVLEKRDTLRVLHEAFNAAIADENKARRSVKLKRQEIDSVLAVINRWKNAMSVEDIDKRILNMEHVIQHETIQLKDEKQFIREIKQLKSLRDQLASNMGTNEEIRQAIDQKDQNEERLKTLRKELDALKVKVSKAEEVVKAVRKKYNEERDRETEMQNQFRAADGVRQQAYAHLNSLKKLSYDKNRQFRQYKEDLAEARHFDKCGDKDSLHRLCAYQVETFMEQWNNNDEFRNEYTNRWTTNANRRQRAQDASSLVRDDDVSPAQPSVANQETDTSLVSIPIEVKSVSNVEKGKLVSLTEDKHAVDSNKSIENISGQKNQASKSKGPAKSTSRSDVATVAEVAVVTKAIDDIKEEENTSTKEEIELARKAEELKKAEAEAKLKEQRRVEEKAKAMEALERKKRNAEKAQIRAEIRARKEAEQKEKEREKRLRKKEKKKLGGDGSLNGEDAASSESSNEATAKEQESVKEQQKKKTHKPPPHSFSKLLKPKPTPPPQLLRNRRNFQYYVKICLAVGAIAFIVFLFLLGSGDHYVNLKFPGRRGV
ncbi:uncharacterized protein [Rutidosis leptorrhynchoides]|uniref:uncharacterized protein n=1 Tax=Rutidosis leptorrhynchoides TaxID=125765 RepID=UPI003A9A1933